jgi:uroporphyrinogen-III synthase
LRVLVTRPEPQAGATAALLRARGHEAHVAPVARIERLEATLPPAEAVDAVILTSANAAFALAPYRELPVYAVGAATARSARAEGATSVTTAAGDWRSLARLLSGPEGPPAGTRLLHLSGAEIRGDLAGALAAAGLSLLRVVVYAAHAESWLDPRVSALLTREALDAVLFFSPAHATMWRRQIERAAAADRLFALHALALSEAVAEPLRALPWRAVEVAAAPEVALLIDRLEARE